MNTLDLDVKARALAEGLGLLDDQGALRPEGLRGSNQMDTPSAAT